MLVWYMPVGQTKHAEAETPPDAGDDFPASHGVHTGAAANEYVPAAQVLHAVVLPDDVIDFPGVQLMHPADPVDGW